MFPLKNLARKGLILCNVSLLAIFALLPCVAPGRPTLDREGLQRQPQDNPHLSHT